MKPIRWLGKKIVHWLTDEDEPTGTPPCDFDRLSFEIRPCDVLLVEGRSRVSEVIKTITQSIWTHSALYIGRLSDIEDPTVREHVSWLYDGPSDDQLIIEPLLGEGTIVSPLKKYANDHLRICRPSGLSPQDAQTVVKHASKHLGHGYDVRHLLDIGRFLHAFSLVHFPILPVVHKTKDGLRLYKRNTRLYTPRDFDYSPYFEIIKYPLLGLNDLAVYRQLPWDQDGVICNSENDCFLPVDTGNLGTENITAFDPATQLVTETHAKSAAKHTGDEIIDAEFPAESTHNRAGKAR
jgi:hypothetical protein